MYTVLQGKQESNQAPQSPCLFWGSQKQSMMQRWWNSSWATSNPKNDAVKVLHSISQQIWKTQQWPQDWKRSVFIPIPKKGNVKEFSNYHTIALISHASKVMLKILQARLQQYMNHKLPDIQAGWEKAEEPEIKLPTSADHRKSERAPEKYFLLLSWLCQSLWLCGSQQTEKFLNRWE